MLRRAGLLCVSLLLASATASAQSAVYLVRHAERADTVGGAAPKMGTDPSLSDVGRARAESLAGMLKDAQVTAIFVTEYKRTQETAAPLAKRLGLQPTVIPSKDTPGLVAKLRAATGNVLVVGHSNSVPDVIKGLGVAKVPAIADDEYDNLFIVTAPSTLIQLRFQ
jgi:phosphohistidine phosphatase SixA